MKIPMTDIDFEKLEKSIEQKMLELSCLQELYIKETGQCYIPAILIHEKTPEELR
ncbi:MAG: hypothetical protein KAS66_10670 [Candidatus Omnitrophica bacterium]|nr:hypothetical protein [Candidatus Omnitrophota bacterium]